MNAAHSGFRPRRLRGRQAAPIPPSSLPAAWVAGRALRVAPRWPSATLPPTCASRDSAGCGGAAGSAGSHSTSEVGSGGWAPLEPVAHRRGDAERVVQRRLWTVGPLTTAVTATRHGEDDAAIVIAVASGPLREPADPPLLPNDRGTTR
jgi:hypothetical protein